MLAECHADLRGRPRSGPDESLEAIQTIYCGGDATPFALPSPSPKGTSTFWAKGQGIATTIKR